MAKTGRKAETVSFRLGDPLLARLEHLGEEARPSVKRGAVAKQLVVAELQDDHRLELQHQMKRFEQKFGALHQELADLRHDLSVIVETILLNLTPATKEQVEEFVKAKLRG